MFVDELRITAKAGDGGDGVVRWHHEKFKPLGGPAGGNGGNGGDVYVRAVRDLGLLSKYTGIKEFHAKHGEEGRSRSQFGKAGEDLYVDVPVGATVTDETRERIYVLEHEGDTHKILHGGHGGIGNEHFKSSTNRAPLQSTEGRKGEEGTFLIELSLIVDVGLTGIPNAGKSTLLNALTNANSRIGAYPFTTTEPHLGEFYGYVIADIPGIVLGAAEGKGLGHKFLRHIQKTKMILHCVSLEDEEPMEVYKTVRSELEKFNPQLLEKKEWIILTKSDLVSKEVQEQILKQFSAISPDVFVISAEVGDGIKELRDELVREFRKETTQTEKK